MRMPWISNKEKRELTEWWEKKKRLRTTPVKWKPKGNLKRLNTRPKAKIKTIDSKPEQGYTDDNTSLSSENPLPSRGQGILSLKDKDDK